MRTRVLQSIRLALTLASLAFVAARVRHLGLETVVGSLPRSPLFYVILVAGYFVMPVFEWRIYQRFWALSARDFGLLLRKRAFNEAVLDYSGELEFYLQMRRRPRAAALIKDVNLLSGAVSNGVTILLLMGLALAGHLSLLDQIKTGLARAAVTASGVTGAILAGFSLTHRRLLSVDRESRIYILSQHAARLLVALGVLVGQWSAAVPGVGLDTWILFVTAWMVVTRIPLLPSRDLLLAALGLALSTMVAAPQPAVAAMFVAGAAVPLILHVCVLLVTAVLPARVPDPR